MMPGNFGFRYAAASYWRVNICTGLPLLRRKQSTPIPSFYILATYCARPPLETQRGRGDSLCPWGRKCSLENGMPGYVRYQVIQQVYFQMWLPQVWGTKYKTVTWKNSGSPGRKNSIDEKCL